MGSAPERGKSKNQLRKERKAKSKEATETKDEPSPAQTPPTVEDVAPIVARQKKKKRTQDRTTIESETKTLERADKQDSEERIASEIATPKLENSHEQKVAKENETSGVGRSAKAVEAELVKKTTIPSIKKQEKALSESTTVDSYTLQQLLAESGRNNDPAAFARILDEHVSSVQKLFSQLFENQDLDSSSALFNLPPLGSYRVPPDSRKGADYLDATGYTMSSPFGEVYLSSKERKALQQGQAVRISDPNRPNDLLRRTMITSNGAMFRHLSQEEEARVLEIEKLQEEAERTCGELGVAELSKLDDADFPNIEGGLEELLRYGAKHGVSWVTAEGEGRDAGVGNDEEGAELSDDGTDDLATIAGGWQAAGALGAMPAAAEVKNPIAAIRAQKQGQGVNLRQMDIEELQKRIRETQAEMEQAKKDVEAMDKKWAKKGKEVSRWREGILKGKLGVWSD